jgi:hypothetical protein
MIPANERPRWAPWDRSATLALLALVGVALASLVWLVHPWYEAGNETNDASIYIACAKSMVAGQGYAYLGEPFTVRPPGFAALIAPVIAWRGLDFHALNLLVSLTGVALVTCLFVFARARLGTWIALSISLAVWFNDGFRTLCCQVMSDVPGAALLFLYLLVERWAVRSPSWKRNSFLGLVVGLSAYVRSILILLGPATLLSRVCDKISSGERSGWLRFLATRVVPLAATLFLTQLPWNVRNALHAPQTPVDQNFLHSYSTAMWHVDGGDPASPRRTVSELVQRIPGRAIQVLDALGRRMRAPAKLESDDVEQSAGTSDLLETAIGAALLAALVFVAWRRREPAEIFALAAVAVLLVYFGFRDRLVLPIWILALPATAECALLLARRAFRARAEIAVAVLFLALPVLDFRPRAGWDRIEKAHAVTTELCAALAAKLAPGERVAAPVGWHYSVYLDRPVWSLFFGARREGSMQGAEEVLAKRAIDAVVLSPLFPADRAMIPWFREHHGPGEPAGAGFVFRVKR